MKGRKPLADWLCRNASSANECMIAGCLRWRMMSRGKASSRPEMWRLSGDRDYFADIRVWSRFLSSLRNNESRETLYLPRVKRLKVNLYESNILVEDSGLNNRHAQEVVKRRYHGRAFSGRRHLLLLLYVEGVGRRREEINVVDVSS